MFKQKPLEEITVPDDRQRREFDETELKDLAESIESPIGLIHAPVLRDDEQTLVVGERRLRAMQMLIEQGRTFTYQGQELKPGHIPYTTFGDLDEYRLQEAELTENVLRVDLTWQEKNRAIARLHEFRKGYNPEHTKSDTAREIAGTQKIDPGKVTEVSNALLLSKNMDRPEVSKAKSTHEAVKAATKAIEREFRGEMAKRRSERVAESSHALIHGSFEQEMPKVQPFDCMIADPPYGINADSTFGDMSNLDHEYDDSTEAAMARYKLLAEMAYQYSKPECHAYVFLDPLYFREVHDMFEAAGWWAWRAPIVWCKGNAGLLPYPNHGPRRTTEFILFAIKGDKRVTAVYLDHTPIPNVKDKVHAAQKPVELYQDLIRRSCFPNEVILDPMAGSGPIFPAATRESCTAIGIEQNDESYQLCLERISLGDDDE